MARRFGLGVGDLIVCCVEKYQRPTPKRKRRGQSLVEFALVALVMYLLLAATIEFGLLLHAAQTLQSAADVAAREISRTPLPAAASFEDVVKPGTAVDQAVYSENFLAVDITDQPADQTMLDYLDGLGMPPVNRILVPTMVISRVNGRTLLRYPGALITSPTAPSGYTVKIPIVTARGPDGVESLRWVNVVEDMQAGDDAAGPGDPTDPFSVVSPERGLVALRINYPYQAATMTAFQPVVNGSAQGNLNAPIVADDSRVDAESPPGGDLIAPDAPGPGLYGGPHGGAYGLGELGALNSPQLANGLPLRPFRRVISAQAVARREVFSNN